MANIPGINGFVQPGTFARDRVISRGVSIPGGTRIVCVMGEGQREEVIIDQARGGGLDGNSDCSPTGSGDGRFFKLSNAPVVSGRTELYLNNTLLYGMEGEIDDAAFDGKFDFRLDPDTGCIELQGASIGDQDGKKYSASNLNVGNGTIPDGTCGDFQLISVIDSSAPAERWTIRAVGVVRDANGDPIPGRTTFTATGSISGQVRNENGQPYLFTDSYHTGTAGAISGNAIPAADGFVVADSADFSVGSAILKSGDATTDTTDQFAFDGNLIAQGQAVVGDYLCIDGYIGVEIEDISYDSSTDVTTLTLVTDSLDTTIEDVAWEIRATNVFIDDPSVAHNGTTGVPATAGNFSASDLGKVLMICSGTSMGMYKVTQVTSSRRIRIEPLSEETQLPSLEDDDADGLAEENLTFHLLQTNGILLFGINSGSIPFEVGDKFFIDVNSRVLAENDQLVARYIAEADLNDPELFVSAADLTAKHGTPSLTNTLSLGAQMAFENGAPAVLALQTKPALPRRTVVTLLEEELDSEGGFQGGVEVDDLRFIIPRPIAGLLNGRPDSDTQVNIFIVRDNEDIQIFPNKVDFYNSQLETITGQNNFISSSDYSFSYTIINTDSKIEGFGDDGEISASAGTLSTLSYNFDGDDVGKIIVVQSLEDSSSTKITTESAIGTHLFGDNTAGVELVITAVINDSTVTVVANDGSDTDVINDAKEVQFFVKDESDTTNTSAALLLHKDLVTSGTLRTGDGIKISYIDEKDADFYDSNWFEAFEALEREDCQIVVPLPTQNRSGIFRAAINHVNTMSSISIQKERVALIGAQRGVTAEALIGLEEVAVEDLGILEGIQGDDAEEVLDGNVEDLVNYKLSENYDEKRAMYFYPDEIVREVQGTNQVIDGFYMAAAAGGWFSGTQNIALPLTNKVLTGFSIPRGKKHRPFILNALGSEGVTVLQPVTGGGRVLAGRTTSHSGFVEDEEPSIIFIRDRVKQVIRDGLRPFIGTVESNNTRGILSSRVNSIMSALVSQGLITSFDSIRIEKDKVDPRQWNVYARYSPAYPLNFLLIDLEVGVI